MPVVCQRFSYQKRGFSNVERPHVSHRPVSQRADEVGDGGARQAAGLEVADVVIPQDAQSSGCQLGGVGDPHPGEPWVKICERLKYLCTSGLSSIRQIGNSTSGMKVGINRTWSTNMISHPYGTYQETK